MTTPTTRLDLMENPISEALKSLLDTRDNEKIELTIGELRGAMLNCMMGTRQSYTESACAVEQFIMELKMRKHV